MKVRTTLKRLALEDALALVDRGACFVDLRPVRDYLDVHVPGSLSLLYEAGPGMAARARDCVPLDVALVVLEGGAGDVVHAAASLRGKGFTVLGSLPDGVAAWARARGTPVSTEVVDAPSPPDGTVLDVGDHGAPPSDGARRIPIETLWPRLGELRGAERVVVASGFGVRAALAVGMLERAGVGEVVVWRRRDRGDG
ncbi:MAG TPA: hypothetical protein VHJ34_02590 [Actinomycetota bacterium]|nr:hypothetical protein [Actinomycetota bacterium]